MSSSNSYTFIYVNLYQVSFSNNGGEVWQISTVESLLFSLIFLAIYTADLLSGIKQMIHIKQGDYLNMKSLSTLPYHILKGDTFDCHRIRNVIFIK